ncbi:ImmA/IrrE family metallo-endopeptidase [Leisingera sp. NJS201]|uniref:ImmA/IrrE family metallo-endopeptidase n=2 Tax=unclassified Leisingera TaxID=2614906 RepID=UPI0020C7DF80|nr:ImmA/IrrE family metallo-endopeptidase [Leisingera sp. NJS201]
MMNKRPIDIVKERLDTVPVNVGAILRALDVDVRKDAELGEDISGEIRRDGERYIVSTSGDEHAFRQRFTLAHELGHFVLHKSLIGTGLDDSKMYRSTEAGDFYNTAIKLAHERQANSFAAKVLMPKPLLKQKIEEMSEGDSKPHISELCDLFQVSYSAMKWRLVNLGWAHKVEGIV